MIRKIRARDAPDRDGRVAGAGGRIIPAARAKKSPAPIARGRAYTWRRPTLTRPIVSLPLALRRFTSGFGMGPGGSTTLWSPEGNLGVQWRLPLDSKLGLWGPEGTSNLKFEISDLRFKERAWRPARPLSGIHTENLLSFDPWRAGAVRGLDKT